MYSQPLCSRHSSRSGGPAPGACWTSPQSAQLTFLYKYARSLAPTRLRAHTSSNADTRTQDPSTSPCSLLGFDPRRLQVTKPARLLRLALVSHGRLASGSSMEDPQRQSPVDGSSSQEHGSESDVGRRGGAGGGQTWPLDSASESRLDVAPPAETFGPGRIGMTSEDIPAPSIQSPGIKVEFHGGDHGIGTWTLPGASRTSTATASRSGEEGRPPLAHPK